MKYDAVVVGGGIGGLSAALSLQQAGFKVIVLERDQHMEDRKQGYGLTLTNSLTGPLAKLGLLEECIERNCPSHCHFIFSPAGEVQGYFGRALKDHSAEHKPAYQQALHGGNRGNLRIPRQELRSMMIQRLAEGSVQWGCKLIRYDESEDGVTVHIHGPHGDMVLTAHVLIGADGLRSKVRRLYDPLSSLHYLDVAVIIGISSIACPLLTDKGYYIMDGQRRLFTMPFLSSTGDKAQPLIMWQLSFAGLSEEQSTLLRALTHAELIADALQRVEGWFPAVHRLISATLPGEVWATPLYDRDPMDVTAVHRTASTHRVTVLGDACHPMSMFKGQGANQALEDAPALTAMLIKALEREHGKKLTKSSGAKRKRDAISDDVAFTRDTDGCLLSTLPLRVLSSSLRTFEREMVARTSKKVLASREAAAYLHSQRIFDEAAPATDGRPSHDLLWTISGVEQRDYARFTDVLRHMKINAQDCPDDLEERMIAVNQRLEEHVAELAHNTDSDKK